MRIDGYADLTDCNIHDNVATDVRPLLKLNPHSVVSHDGTLRVLMVGRVAGDSASMARQR